MAAMISGVSVLGACGSTTGPEIAGETTDAAGAVVCPDDGDEWEVAKIYIEHNATDEDTGIHGLIGGEPWETVCVTTPDGTRLWTFGPADRLRDLGASEFFWESNEPPNDEYSIEDLKQDFPEGPYLVSGTGIDGTDRIAEATFSHTIPAAPEITHPSLVPDFEDADPLTIDAVGLVIRWEPVTETIEGQPVAITGYQVIVTEEEAEDPNGSARPVYDVHVDPHLTALQVPDEFMKAGTLYELEVLAIESTGNQTISVGFFRTN